LTHLEEEIESAWRWVLLRSMLYTWWYSDLHPHTLRQPTLRDFWCFCWNVHSGEAAE